MPDLKGSYVAVFIQHPTPPLGQRTYEEVILQQQPAY